MSAIVHHARDAVSGTTKAACNVELSRSLDAGRVTVTGHWELTGAVASTAVEFVTCLHCLRALAKRTLAIEAMGPP